MNSPDPQLAGLGLPLFLITLLLLGWIATLRKRQQNLTKQHNTLLQEKEAALGFVQNIGSVFADAETVEMSQLLERVLHYAVRTCKAGSGAIYLLDADTNLTARALSGVIPPSSKSTTTRSRPVPTPPSNSTPYSPKKNSPSAKPSSEKLPASATPFISKTPNSTNESPKPTSSFFAFAPSYSSPCDLVTT